MKPHPEALRALSRLLDYWPGEAVSEAATRAYLEAITGVDPRLPVDSRDVVEAVNRLCTGAVHRKSHEYLPKPGFLSATIRECRNVRLEDEARSKPRLPPYQPRVVTEDELATRRAMVAKLRAAGGILAAAQDDGA